MSSSNGPASTTTAKQDSSRHRFAWLLIIPFIAMVIPPLFNFREPTISGVPFFYWYLLLWIPLTSFLTWVAYRR
jgi:hypothetical protein